MANRESYSGYIHTTMPPADTDDTTGLPAEVRAAGLELTDGELLVYDPRNHRAWLQTDAPLDLDGYR